MSTAAPLQRPGPQIVRQLDEPEVSFTPTDRLEPGEYPAYCRKATIYWDSHPIYKRWVCLLNFDIYSADDLLPHQLLGRVPMFLNLGWKEKPHAGKRGNYWATWSHANGGPPGRRDRMSPRIFERRAARVVVGDVKTTFRDRKTELPEHRFYSVAREILCWATGPRIQHPHTQGRHELNASG